MVPLIITLLVLVLVVFPLWALFRILSLGKENEALGWRLAELERELRELRSALRAGPAEMPVAAATAPISAPPRVAPLPQVSAPPPEIPVAPETPAMTAFIPPAPPTPVVSALPPDLPVPQPMPARPPVYVPPPPRRVVTWEQFMGAKLFAWLGGLAAFLGAAFFVKYSFDHDLIPPEVRVALGYLFALGLIVGGLKLARGRYAITAQTLCATGVVSLYAVTFACNSIYHFAFFGPLATFALMSLVTAAAFVLAVRLEAQVVAILGMLGGFLTPVLLSTGRDNPTGLFGYIALLDLGLIAVALHRRWHFLAALGAAGTIVMQIGWATKYLNAVKAPTAMVVCLVFCALYLAAYYVARRLAVRGTGRPPVSSAEPGEAGQASTEPHVSPHLLWSAVAFPFVAFGFAATFLDYGTVSAQPGRLFSFVLAADLCLLALAWHDETLPRLHLAAGVAVFALLAAWTGGRLTPDLLPWALVFYLAHAILHTAFPLVLERHRPGAAPAIWSQLFPPLALLLLLGPVFKLDTLSLAFWPCVLLVDLLAIGLALITASVAGVAIVLVLTLTATGLWLFRVPAAAMAGAAPSLLLVIGGFALLFFAAGLFLSRRLGAASNKAADWLGGARGQIPAFSALLPFLLLVMMTQRLPLANPSPVFGLALLLAILALGLARLLLLEWLPACALAGVAALEYAWQARHAALDHAPITLAWYLVFYAAFSLYPFLFRRHFAALTGPWAVAALAGVVQFPLVYRLIERVRPNDIMGLLPALFTLAPLAGLIAVLRAPTADTRARLNQLAWFGGVALLFITLIFPIQFERQWITLGWALEGVALLWLFHRVPHPALRATGVTLLVIAFGRLALNPTVLEYRARSGLPILNWYLYSYGFVTAALFVGARLLGRPGTADAAAPPVRIFGLNASALLATLGTVLAFLLLNLEIADFFAAPGARVLTFEFSGHFGRDMSYTIGWALFALGLLLVSFWKRLPAGRYAAIALLGVALLKLFFHDLARLEALYRIGALFALAVIAIVASFAYQRFLPSDEKRDAEKT